jgi:stearoyl-CoA desaturase (delta-9 desaturase)
VPPNQSPPAPLPPNPLSPKSERLSEAEGWWATQRWLTLIIYWGIHVACLLGFVFTPSATDLALCAATFFGRMFFITGGYHRYFAHKSYKTSRAFQFVLAYMGATSIQKGPLWWASHHRVHHKFADQPGKDTHSPKDGFWWSHQAWIFDDRFNGSDIEGIRDFARFPELVWLNRWHIVAPLSLAIVCALIGGASGLLWGFVVSTTLLWHSTYAINSLAHVFGRRRYATPDDSRNNPWLALLTLGEGWHNNHHHFCTSARQGFFWWEIDITYYVLRALQALGVVWDIREPPRRVIDATIAAREAGQPAA